MDRFRRPPKKKLLTTVLIKKTDYVHCCASIPQKAALVLKNML